MTGIAGAPAMPRSDAEPSAPPAERMTNCPQCRAELAVLRIIPGRAGAEYWTFRCTRCGGIHLDIVQSPSVLS